MSTCNCKKEIEAKLLERFKRNAPEARQHGVELEGYSFVIVENSLKERPCMQFKTSALFPLKNGSEKLKNSRANMFFSFCPFCGTKID